MTVCGVANVARREKDKVELDERLATLTIGADGAMDYASHPIEDGPVDEMELELLTAEGKLDKDAYIFDVRAGGRAMLARVRDTGLTTFSSDFVNLVRDYQLTGKAGRKKEFFESYNSPYYGIERSNAQDDLLLCRRQQRHQRGCGNGDPCTLD